MSTGVINNKIRINYPEGFREMTVEELSKLFVKPDADRFGLWDEDSHIVLTAEWQKQSKLLLKLVKVENIARNNEQGSAKGYANNDYKLLGFFTRQVAGTEAAGYSFTYKVEDVNQCAASILLIKDGVIYRFTCVGRAENQENDWKLFGQILDEVEFM